VFDLRQRAPRERNGFGRSPIRITTAPTTVFREHAETRLSDPITPTTDVRLTRRLYVRERLKIDLIMESFNLLNRDNKRVLITQTACNRVRVLRKDQQQLGINYYPGHFQIPRNPTASDQFVCLAADTTSSENDF